LKAAAPAPGKNAIARDEATTAAPAPGKIATARAGVTTAAPAPGKNAPARAEVTTPLPPLASSRGATPESIGTASDATAPKLNAYQEIEEKWKQFQARFDEMNRLLVSNIAQSMAAEGAAKKQEKVSSLRSIQRNERQKRIA
jgi:hypothetical protein